MKGLLFALRLVARILGAAGVVAGILLFVLLSSRSPREPGSIGVWVIGYIVDLLQVPTPVFKCLFQENFLSIHAFILHAQQ